MKFNVTNKFENNFDGVTYCGDGHYTKKCCEWIEDNFKVKKALLTTSCTHALEMAAILLNIQKDDEIIMPSYTFVSTANAFVLRGAKIVFVDVRPDTMNIDENKIEAAITSKTKAIVVVHYAGVPCEMDTVMEISKKHNLFVVEDAAQAVMSTYKGQSLGSIGDIGCFSFHETKNYSMGEGGAILINNNAYIERAEVIREKGTNRSRFLKGQVDKYTWVDVGSSYLPSDILACYLWNQLQNASELNQLRLTLWKEYMTNLDSIAQEGKIALPKIPENCSHNAHMFYLKCKDEAERQALISKLNSDGVQSVFHYIPLHSSPFGVKVSRFSGKDCNTTKESERLLRLPMHNYLTVENVRHICELVKTFYAGNDSAIS